MEIICIHDGRIKYGMKEFVSQEFNVSWICHISTTRRFHFDGGGGKEINSMQYSPFWKEDSFSADYEIPTFIQPEVLLPCSLMSYIQPIL